MISGPVPLAVEVVDVHDQVGRRGQRLATRPARPCPSRPGGPRRPAAWRWSTDPPRRRSRWRGPLMSSVYAPGRSGRGQVAGARRLPAVLGVPLAVVGLDRPLGVLDRRLDALQEPVVEAHGLVEPAGAAHLQAAVLVGLVAAHVLPRSQPALLLAGVVLQVLGHAVGHRVVLGQALGQEQRHVRALAAPGSCCAASSTSDPWSSFSGLGDLVLRLAGRLGQVGGVEVVARVQQRARA